MSERFRHEIMDPGERFSIGVPVDAEIANELLDEIEELEALVRAYEMAVKETRAGDGGCGCFPSKEFPLLGSLPDNHMEIQSSD